MSDDHHVLYRDTVTVMQRVLHETVELLVESKLDRPLKAAVLEAVIRLLGLPVKS
jgi:hypothetical protein